MDKLISEKAVLDVLRDYYRAWFLNDERFMDAVNAIKAIPSAEPCEDVLDKIRAEIEKPLREERFFDTDTAKAQAIALSWCLEIIDRYRNEEQKRSE